MEIWEAKKSNCAQLSGTLINFFNVCVFFFLNVLSQFVSIEPLVLHTRHNVSIVSLYVLTVVGLLLPVLYIQHLYCHTQSDDTAVFYGSAYFQRKLPYSGWRSWESASLMYPVWP